MLEERTKGVAPVTAPDTAADVLLFSSTSTLTRTAVSSSPRIVFSGCTARQK